MNLFPSLSCCFLTIKGDAEVPGRVYGVGESTGLHHPTLSARVGL